MKLHILLGIIAFTLPGVGRAAEAKKSIHDQFTGQGYGMAGCGLGSIIFGKKEGMIQVVAATSNALAGNQTFAISSGTSNCEGKGASTASRAEFFVSQNESALKNDIARGQGETLQGLSKIAQCEKSEKVAPALQASFVKIYPTSNTSSAEASSEILSILAKNKSLACKLG